MARLRPSQWGQPRMATATELWLVLWGSLLALATFWAGALDHFLDHRENHHIRDSQGACESVTLCSAYAPRSLCAEWRDQPA